jgi:hypothetical protein
VKIASRNLSRVFSRLAQSTPLMMYAITTQITERLQDGSGSELSGCDSMGAFSVVVAGRGEASTAVTVVV